MLKRSNIAVRESARVNPENAVEGAASSGSWKRRNVPVFPISGADVMSASWAKMSGKYWPLPLGDLEGDGDREQMQQMYSQMALVSGLRLGFSYTIIQHSADKLMYVETNAPGLGMAFYICAGGMISGDILCVMSAIGMSTVLLQCQTEDQLFMIKQQAASVLRVPFRVYTFATCCLPAASIIELVVRAFRLDTALYPDLSYEVTDYSWHSHAGTALVVAMVVNFVLFFIMNYALDWVIALVGKSHVNMNMFDLPPMPIEKGVMPCFANPSAKELRCFLVEYWQVWGPGLGMLNNPTPRHFTQFVLAKVRAQGHDSLSYVAQRMAKALFEEKIQRMMAAENVKIERLDLLVGVQERDLESDCADV